MRPRRFLGTSGRPSTAPLGRQAPLCVQHWSAIDLWRAASFAGHSEAQWHLGNAYEAGSGVQKDLTKAFAWYRCSEESASTKVRRKVEGFELEADILNDAGDSVRQLRERLSASELARGEALANEYIARYGKPPP